MSLVRNICFLHRYRAGSDHFGLLYVEADTLEEAQEELIRKRREGGAESGIDPPWDPMEIAGLMLLKAEMDTVSILRNGPSLAEVVEHMLTRAFEAGAKWGEYQAIEAHKFDSEFRRKQGEKS